MARLGEVLFQLRRRRRLLQKQVAIGAGVDPSYLAGLEGGRRAAPSQRVVSRLLSVLEATKQDRARVQLALKVLEMERVIMREPDPLPGAEILVLLAERLPRMTEEEVRLAESLIRLLGNQNAKEEVATM